MLSSPAVAIAITVLFVLGLVVFRLLWAGSQLTAAAELGRLPGMLPKKLRRWLFGERS